MQQKILITGAAGFIGFHLAKALLDSGNQIIGIDNLNDYYDVSLKEARLGNLQKIPGFQFYKIDLTAREKVKEIFELENPFFVIHLAAQAGVRYSLKNPFAYLESNIAGFMSILEACRHFPVSHLIFASSSSVYGANKTIPYSVHDNVDHPVSLYAATKKSNELMAHTYANLFAIPVTGLRFFTVYGPWGRPDMAYFSFTKAILEEKPIDVYNFGKMKRDFTYIDDIVEAITKLIKMPPKANSNWDFKNPDPSSSFAPYKIYNIGNNQPVELEKMISTLEDKLGKKAVKNYKPLQPGDVLETFADINDLQNDIGFKPCTSIEIGLEKFVNWYKSYFKYSF